MRGREAFAGNQDVAIPQSVKPGTRIDFMLAPYAGAAPGCEQPLQPLNFSVVVGVPLK